MCLGGGVVEYSKVNIPAWRSTPHACIQDDLVDAVCASCHIPYYLGPSVGSEFRGQVRSLLSLYQSPAFLIH